MLVETALVAALALALGYAWGLKRKPSASPPDFSRLQAQMMHARNMGMRMNELASSEVKLERERLELERLMALKEEVQWLLETVETMIQHPDPNRHDMLEQLLDATGKSLRLLLNFGQAAIQPWPTLCDGLQHLHKTLCLAREIHPSPPINSELQNTENKYDSVTLSQQLIEIHRKGWTQNNFPFVMEQKGLTLVLPTHRKSIAAEAQESLEA